MVNSPVFTKNPVFTFMAQHDRDPLHLGTVTPPRVLMPFTYLGGRIATEEEFLDVFRNWPHPHDIFVDSSFFSPQHATLSRRILIERTVQVIPQVKRELKGLKKFSQEPGHWTSSIFEPDGHLSSRLQQHSTEWAHPYEYAINRYSNLLHLRRHALEAATREFETRKGRPPLPNERRKLQRAALAQGMSQRTLHLATKDHRNRHTDEALAVLSVLRPIITGRDCMLLTADTDLFEQVFQFTQLLHDDYGSFLIAHDFAQNPLRYPHRHDLDSQFLEAGSLAIGRIEDPDYLLPIIYNTCAVGVFDVATRDSLLWVCIREIEQMLQFQSQSADGRVASGPDGTNVHMSLPISGCSFDGAHFAIGIDKIWLEFPSRAGIIRLSHWDVARVMKDRKLGHRVPRRVWMRGRAL